mmetsp:Transcript_129673/g.336349  ORF Transcript_129673/g.336349 Transcript_129673/m.336349 type:complete len:542 (-) Transcript_129673:506-2131(-)
MQVQMQRLQLPQPRHLIACGGSPSSQGSRGDLDVTPVREQRRHRKTLPASPSPSWASPPSREFHKLPTPVRTPIRTPTSRGSPSPMLPGQLEFPRSPTAAHQGTLTQQAPMAAPRAPSCGEHRGSFEVEDLRIAGTSFDMSQPEQRALLAEALGMTGATKVEAMQGISGGLNDGIWFVRGGEADLVVKLVRGSRRFSQEPTEAEALMQIFSEHPHIASDPLVGFPFKILHLQGDEGALGQDLIAMEKAPGKALATVVSEFVHSGRAGELQGVLQHVGEAVGVFHGRYAGKQHGDLQGSNIFFDQGTSHVTLIDVGGMGSRMTRSDEDHFVYSLQILKAFYEPHIENWCSAFRDGHQRGKHKAPHLPLPVTKRARGHKSQVPVSAPLSPVQQPQGAASTTAVPQLPSEANARPLARRLANDSEAASPAAAQSPALTARSSRGSQSSRKRKGARKATVESSDRLGRCYTQDEKDDVHADQHPWFRVFARSSLVRLFNSDQTADSKEEEWSEGEEIDEEDEDEGFCLTFPRANRRSPRFVDIRA